MRNLVAADQRQRDGLPGIIRESSHSFAIKTFRTLRLLFFAAFWSAKSGAKIDPPTKKAKRRGLTLAPGARLKGGFKGRWTAERVISDTTLSLLKPASYAGARAFSPHLFERLFCQAGFIRRHSGGKDASGTSRKHRSLRSPLEAVLNRRILACSGERTTDSPRARSGRLAKASAGEGRQLAVCRAATA